MFCRNCGKELNNIQEICLSCAARPLVGSSFCQECGKETYPLAEICVNCGVSLRTSPKEVEGVSPKSRLATTLLAFFLGVFGAHRFYTGKTGSAIAILVLALVGFATALIFIGIYILIAVEIWALVDFIFAVSGNAQDAQGHRIINWYAR